MSQDRPAISEEIKREVRKRCGFGCIICGLPIYHYEHMEDYVINPVHEAENITLLCPTHHQQKTSGQMTTEMIQRYNKHPINIRKEASSSLRNYFMGNRFTCQIGPNWYTLVSRKSSVLLRMAGEDIIKVDIVDEEPLLSLKVYDIDGELVLNIDRNEIAISTKPFDITFVGNKITIWRALYKRIIKIELCPPDTIKIMKGNLRYRNCDIQITHKRLIINAPRLKEAQFYNNVFEDNGVGLSI